MEIHRHKTRLNISKIFRYLILSLVSIIMLYPILWMIGASFKTNSEIFTQIGIIPKKIDFSPYFAGWKTRTEYTFTTYFINTFKIVIPKLIFSLISSTITAYGFARFEFPFKKLLFSLMMATLFLPQIVLRIPLYLLWRDLGALNTYIPLIANTIFAQEPFFVFMLIQFMRSIPRTLDEAATIDGCNSFGILTKVILPSLKPALISCTIFQFVWSFNDYLGPLIYITSVEKYPVSMALKMNIDTSSGVVEWNQIMAMSIISLLPAIILYFSAQKYFVEGVTSTGIKG
ncbi:carbohydrate ABC transporter permease [Tuanshanicoccus lijuaniae]|uniref:carbohydrate ABC transporter permease n=1 Tax=Aerococcaceae bacterium zg-1292 TaxID=2774330 RepID=UPI001BD7FB1F|nr:carbohydrate ABC transporter permease [Aerococcaceae bacterium zg-BR22]MBS4455525.1 carbohydrate ABC transporter permease [Aerococcaceae bacterium zg-A91]MBS4457144.1 carbohydrate ABC transporter permease [Aerococcaceae bacterium zg-BR33]